MKLFIFLTLLVAVTVADEVRDKRQLLLGPVGPVLAAPGILGGAVVAPALAAPGILAPRLLAPGLLAPAAPIII
ncbi:hypothetical protein O3M35_000832 [Rhynocoris fuscipes]|uniref:Uncharacterized protein n=1 Tax=Rhynocoris fuscipes TaxID=488301 RepID=A0AAW1DQB3_9HEMI